MAKREEGTDLLEKIMTLLKNLPVADFLLQVLLSAAAAIGFAVQLLLQLLISAIFCQQQIHIFVFFFSWQQIQISAAAFFVFRLLQPPGSAAAFCYFPLHLRSIC
ncbi:hypothetical protein M9H77_07857 [Catharanthus roseus]|uniref:Uncharacterized protein n=1 Tax=Catharanthus roseus TaxID=4058 RepID=A0ACC0BWD0_CATRO|nr:hypothetical protein M9H77_07857 [Catharanthus roseus]